MNHPETWMTILSAGGAPEGEQTDPVLAVGLAAKPSRASRWGRQLPLNPMEWSSGNDRKPSASGQSHPSEWNRELDQPRSC